MSVGQSSPVDPADRFARSIAELDRRIGEVERAAGRSDATAWTYVTFQSSWADYDTSGTWARAAYRRIGDVVYVRGLVKDGTIGQPVFTLPAGFRPPGSTGKGSVIFPTYTATGVGRVDVEPSGIVRAHTGSNGYFSLSVVQFSTTA